MTFELQNYDLFDFYNFVTLGYFVFIRPFVAENLNAATAMGKYEASRARS
jgi:hypothetical protein